MKFNEQWLRAWTAPELSTDALLEQLTMAGLEVDGTEPVAGPFTGVLVGEVVAVEKHPDADKLSVCSVTDGAEAVQVVCGAPNVRAGLKTAFATVGAKLPGDFKIKAAKLRGVASNGMLCSAAELQLGEDDDGIMELPADTPVGADLREALALDDLTVELDLTPNRGDCLSIAGIAREVGVLNSCAVTAADAPPVPPEVDDTFPVALTAGHGCPRYVGRVIRDINPQANSPRWLVERLRRCGLRAIDPVVDVTNYVLLELGQPMHAFDLERLSERIVVRKAQAGETLTLLDGKEVTLDEDTLTITDASGPVAIAGVMGGEKSGVQPDSTRHLFLESAFFEPLALAGTARRYGLQTDASHRYERGVDYELPVRAMERATRLLLDIVGGRPGPLVETVLQDELPQPARVTLREHRLHQLLGVSVATGDVDDALARLGFRLLDRSADSDGVVWTIEAPSHRFDITAEIDLVEEIARIYGYNQVTSRRPVTDLTLRTVPLEVSPERQLKQELRGLGYQEVVTYSFIEPALADLLGPGLTPVTLLNPMSNDQAAMRTNLLPGLVRTLQDNVNRQQSRVRLFELGQCFVPGDNGLDQSPLLGGLLWGRRQPEHWSTNDETVDFFDLKGDVERLLAQAAVAPMTIDAGEDAVLHPGQSALVKQGDRLVGRLGRLHPELERRLAVHGVYLFELRADAVLARVRRTYRPVSRYPSVRRDLALLVNRSVSAAQVEAVVRGALPELLTEFRLFDLYQGKGIDSNEKSIAVGLTLQNPSATLTDAEIAANTDRVVAALASELGARLR